MSAKECAQEQPEKNAMMPQEIRPKRVEIQTLGIGIRHLQMMCMAFALVVMYMVRAHISVAVLAMTDQSRANDTGITIFSWDKRKQGLILSSFSWTYFIMQVPNGLMARKYGGKPLILFALVANGLLCLLAPLMAEWGDWPMLCAARAAMGLTQASLMPSIHTLLGRWLPAHERNSIIGFVYGGTKIGTILALPLSGILADTALGWKLIFYGTGVLLLLCAAVWWVLAASSPAEHWLISQQETDYIEREMASRFMKKAQPTPWRSILTCRSFWAIAAAHLGFVVFYTFFLSDLPTYLDKNFNMSIKKSAILSTLPFIGMWVAGLIGSYTFGKLITLGYLSVDASRKIASSIAYFGVSAGMLALSCVSPEQKYLAVAILIVSLSLGGLFVSGFMGNHIDISPNYAGLLLSLTNCLATTASFIVPLFVSFVLGNDPTNTDRWRIILISIAAVTCFLNALYLIYGDCEIQPWDTLSTNKKDMDSEETTTVPETKKFLHQKSITGNLKQ